MDVQTANDAQQHEGQLKREPATHELPCPSCGTSMAIPDGAPDVACGACGHRFAVEARNGEVVLRREAARRHERPYFAEAQLSRFREPSVETSRSLEAGCAYAILAFVSATIVAVIVAASADIQSDMTIIIALVALWAGVTGFYVGYRSRKR